jgi:glucose/arabinose dehydrogenase
MRRLVGPVIVASLLALTACSGVDGGAGADALGTPSSSPQPTTRIATVSPAPTPSSTRPRVVRTVATGLAVPWGVAFLPDGTALVGERDTTRVLSVSGGGRGPADVREVGTVGIAVPQGEAGLLGLAASPSYDRDGLVYAYVSTAEDNRVVRMRYDGRRLGEPEPVLTGIPNGYNHDGGRLLFADDGTLFVSTGETGVEQLAQDPDSLGGKILHVTADGEPPPDNPVAGSPVWTLGHRNVQGLAFDDQGRLWASEFGSNTWDELNLIEKRRNYGWPLVEGKGDLEEYRNPFAQWATSDASPSGLAYLDGSLWMGALRGERLWQVPVTDQGTGDPQAWFVGDFGRIRTVQVAPDGNLWITTSNRDGRGTPRPGDDRIVEVRVGG